MIDIILAIALTVGSLAGPIVQGPQGPAGPIPMPPSGALNSAQ
jgi:cytochrome c551/c552